jgi:hypothetical protein
MKTCGIVGHPDSADSSWRIRGSGSTSTAVKETPVARRASSARAEFPHMTKSGRPFMKTATSSVAMTSRIRSWSWFMRFLSSRF